MSTRKAYQTLEDRGNVDEIEINGPFKCNSRSAWLGEGYYFWDSFIDNAHWWGCEGAKYSSYVICQSEFELDETGCFNLVDNPEHLSQFNETKKLLKEQGIYIEGETTVARIIKFIKNTGVFNFEAIRVYGVNSVGFNSHFSNRTILINKSGNMRQYLDSIPAIQINFFTKNSLNRTGFKVVYPHEYVDGYLV